MIAVIHVTMLLKWKRSQLNVSNVILGLQSPENVHSLFISPYTKSDILFIEFGNTLKVKCIIYSGSITMVVKSKINVWTSDKSWEPRNPKFECYWKLWKTWKTLSLTHSLSLDMLNNFYFHVYAQKSLFIAENCNVFFWMSTTSTPTSCEFRVHRAGSQLKNSKHISE